MEFSISFENTGNIGFLYSTHKILKEENQIKTQAQVRLLKGVKLFF